MFGLITFVSTVSEERLVFESKEQWQPAKTAWNVIDLTPDVNIRFVA